MKRMDWLEMLACQENLHRISRQMLRQSRNCTLNAGELEILSLLYLHPEDNTPLGLSRRSGARKESVSRSIRQLIEKECLRKTPNPQDERSRMLSLTEAGIRSLEENYGAILQPMYELQRKMGQDFETLFFLLDRASRALEERTDTEMGNGQKE